MSENTKKPRFHISRKDHVCPIFGAPKDFSLRNLPSYADVILCCFEQRYVMSSSTELPSQKIAFSEIANVVAQKIKMLYMTASIPTVSQTRVEQMITAYHAKYWKKRKSYKRDKENPKFQKAHEIFKTEAEKIFDISSCKCQMSNDCNCGKPLSLCICPNPISIDCGCEKDRKIPVIERKFLFDQRTARVGKIGSIDVLETAKLTRRAERNEKTKHKMTSSSTYTSSVDNAKSFSDDLDDNIEEFVENRSPEVQEHVKDPTFALSPSTSYLQKPSTSQMRINLPETAVISDRFGVSERATAAIATSVLKDLQIVTDTDLTFVIDKNKIRREKSKIRKALQQEPKTMSEALTSLYFDGRKDETLYQEEVGSKRYRKTRKEEHVSIIMEPGSQYITHVTPISGTSKGITESMISHLNEMEFDFSELLLVGCDGTATNTGWRGGIIRRIELYLNRPIQWNICLLHANELPLRHVFQHFDGKTSGPNSFSGTIGKQLQGVEHLPVVNFNKIECDLVQVTCRDNLSKDQKYLYDIGQAIHLGNCSSDLSLRDPGKLSHARWLTLGNRTLRLYISSEDPSENLVHIVTFIMKVYLPMWFQIKLNDSIADGARHVFTMIKNSRYLPEHLLRVVDPVIQHNAYFAHPENLLLSMVTDENRNVRKIGVQRILKARETTSTAKNSVRSFILPKLNFNATNYYEMIDWSSTILSPPPVLRNVLNADLLSSIDNQPSISQWNLSSFPCHTQAVERTVKLVTEASNKVCGYQNRDGHIRSTLFSRSSLPKFDHKSQFVINA